MTVNKEIETLLNRAGNLALAELERRARKILAAHPNLDEFIMGMGCAIFTTKEDENLGTEERAYMKPVERFLVRWDNELKLTGEPMRFTATGPVVTNW